MKNYQQFTKTTAIYPQEKALEYLALGLVSEAGEVAGKVKKIIRDSEGSEDSIRAELGDVLWYISEFCNYFDTSIEELADQNRRKIQSRKERGVLGGSGDNR